MQSNNIYYIFILIKVKIIKNIIKVAVKKLIKYFIIYLLLSITSVVANETTTIEADTMHTKNENVEATGNVIIKKDDYTITTDKVIYNRKDKKFFLNRRAKLISSDKKAVFAENGVINDNIENGTFNDAGIIFDEGLSVFSKKIEKKDSNTYNATDTEYYLCPNKPLNDSWSYDDIINELKKQRLDAFTITSSTSIINMKEKKIYLKSNVFRVFGVPVFYWPYIATSRPFIEKVSGFNLPHFEKLSNYGYGFYVPYTWFVNDDLKFRFEIGYYLKNAVALKAKSVSETDNGRRIIDFVLLDDNDISKNVLNEYNISEKEEGEYKRVRYLLTLDFKEQLSDRLFYDLDFKAISDNYFLRDFLREYDEYQKSEFNFSYINFDSFNYFNFNVLSFNEILANADKKQEKTPLFLPSFEGFFTKNITNNLSFNFKTTFSTTDLFDINDIKYDKLNLFLNVDYSKYFDYFKLKTSFNFYNDNYYENTVITNENHNRRVLSRNIPEVGVELKSLLTLKNNSNISIEPIIQYYGSIKNSKFDYNFLNEDSKESEINALNLFSNNRFNGNDRREYGNRLNYGFINNYNFDQDKKISFRIGQAYKDYFNKDTDIYGFYGEHFSDILGSIGYYDNFFDINYLFNLDKKNFNLNSSEIIYNIHSEKVEIYGSYVFFRKSEIDELIKETNQLKFGMNYNFIAQFNLTYEMTRDFIFNRTTERVIKLFYENNCATSGIALKQHNYKDSESETSINLYFRIKNTMF